MDIESFRVEPGAKVKLRRVPTGDTDGVRDQAHAVEILAKNLDEIADLQERLFIEDRHSVLVILQARDAAGKDSTVKHVFRGVNPAGLRIMSFKVPCVHELDHDYLWRSVVALPERGTVGVHNRSYYEEVVVTRVHPEILEHERLPPASLKGKLWKRRYRQINAFEDFLVDNGTVVVKLFLHVSREEQRRRFLERLTVPEKHWKFSLRDVQERERWDDYDEAYEAMLKHTSTKAAPWFVVPSDHKWYLHAAVSGILVQTLRDLKLGLPSLDAARRRELAEGRRLLENKEK